MPRPRSNAIDAKRPKPAVKKDTPANSGSPCHPKKSTRSSEHTFDPKHVADTGLKLTGDHQVVQHIELLDLPIHVTESRRFEYVDADGNLSYPPVPGWNRGPIFGPKLLTTVGYLKSRCHCSYSTIAALFEDLLAVPVSRGYLAKLSNGVISDSLADADEDLKAEHPKQS